MKTTRKLARLAGRTLKRLYEYRDLAVTAQGMEDKCRDKLISHVCINVQIRGRSSVAPMLSARSVSQFDAEDSLLSWVIVESEPKRM